VFGLEVLERRRERGYEGRFIFRKRGEQNPSKTQFLLFQIGEIWRKGERRQYMYVLL
jgi:hypothetical protein